MGHKQRKANRPCVYCQKRVATTIDHVPPKSLFPKPRPSNLCTVPCCEQCNNFASRDDEYFRVALTSRIDVAKSSAATGLLADVYRGLARDEASGFRQHILDSMKEVELVTKSGLYVGRGAEFKVDEERLASVVERTVRGLFYAIHKSAIPPNWAVAVFMDVGFDPYADKDDNAVKNLINRVVSNGLVKSIDVNVFTSWHMYVGDQAHFSVWFLLFYQAIWFLAFTTDPELSTKRW